MCGLYSLPAPFTDFKSDVALFPIMPFVQSVCSVDKRVVTAAAGVDMNNTLSPQGHITLLRPLTREKSHGAGKHEQEKCLRPHPG